MLLVRNSPNPQEFYQNLDKNILKNIWRDHFSNGIVETRKEFSENQMSTMVNMLNNQVSEMRDKTSTYQDVFDEQTQ